MDSGAHAPVPYADASGAFGTVVSSAGAVAEMMGIQRPGNPREEGTRRQLFCRFMAGGPGLLQKEATATRN